MAAKKLLNPPVLSNVDNIDSWLHDLQIWNCVTDLEKKQQRPIIYLSLPDKIRNGPCRYHLLIFFKKQSLLKAY